jgi:predicted RNA-binding Zn-ribbon protein involved in translation (DUF1610 family)
MTKLQFCESCGFKLSTKANFCPKCGNEAVIVISATKQKSSPKLVPPTTKTEFNSEHTSRRWVVVAAGVALVSLIIFAISIQKPEGALQFSETEVLAAAGSEFTYAGNGLAYAFTGATCAYELNRSCVDLTIYSAQKCDDFRVKISFKDEKGVVLGNRSYMAGFALAAGEKGKAFLDITETPGDTLEAQEITCSTNTFK